MRRMGSEYPNGFPSEVVDLDGSCHIGSEGGDFRYALVAGREHDEAPVATRSRRSPRRASWPCNENATHVSSCRRSA